MPAASHGNDLSGANNPGERESIQNSASELDALVDAQEKLAEERRRTMITPAPANFKPEAAARKVRLKLILEKSILRSGENPRFRLELANVGRDSITYQESDSSIFVKGGGLLSSDVMRFYLTDGHGKRVELMPRIFRSGSSSEIRPQRNEIPKGERWQRETNAKGQAHASFRIKILPGETLHSLGDNDSPNENFKTLHCQQGFDLPGEYKLHVELNDGPAPLSKRVIEILLRTGNTLEQIHKQHAEAVRTALGPISSNAAPFKIIP